MILPVPIPGLSIYTMTKAAIKVAITVATLVTSGAPLLESGGLTYFHPTECHAPQNARLFHEDGEFYLEHDNDVIQVQRAYMDKNLRGIDQDTLLTLLGRKNETAQIIGYIDLQECDLSNDMEPVDEEVLEAIKPLMAYRTNAPYIQVNLNDHGEPTLQLKGRLNGGGFLGGAAGAWFGAFMVNLGTQAAIACVSVPVGMVGGPIAGLAVHKAISATVAPAVAAATTTAALAGGIGGAVLTGPV